MAIFNWVLSNYLIILATLGSINLAAQAIARLTPTKTDDKFVARVQGWLEKAASLGIKPKTE